MSHPVTRDFVMPSLTSAFAVPALLRFSSVTLGAAFLTMVYLHTATGRRAESGVHDDQRPCLRRRHRMAVRGERRLARDRVRGADDRAGADPAPGGSLISVILGLWSLGLLVAAVFPTDALGVETQLRLDFT